MESCVDTPRASSLRLNASALSDIKSFVINLASELIPDPFQGLVDSGSSDCFMDSQFASRCELPVRTMDPPLPIVLIDGTINNYVTQIVTMPTLFPTGEIYPIDYYVTPLESTCAVVLGLSWLLRYNLLIDWRLGHIAFHSTSLQDLPAPSTKLAAASAQLLPSDPPKDSPDTSCQLDKPTLGSSQEASEPLDDPCPNPSVNPLVSPPKSHISFVNAVA